MQTALLRKQMGISHEYNHAYRRARQRGKYTKLKVAASAAAILVLSLGITAILETAEQENSAASEILPSGTVEGILAPLPMQPGEAGGQAGGQILNFGPVRQTAGAYGTLGGILINHKMEVMTQDYKVIPENLTALKEKYNIKIDPNTIIPEDKELINNLFQAGLEMLVTTGYYCQDLGRVMHVTEEEVWEGIKKTPTKLILGEGKDIARFYPRHGNSNVKPVIQGGPTGSPISEDVFVQVMQSYAQEGIVDTIVNGVMTTIEGHPAKSKTPYEIRATMAELRATKEARVRAGRPGLGV